MQKSIYPPALPCADVRPDVSSGTLRATVAEYLHDTSVRGAQHKFVTVSIVLVIVASLVLLVVETSPELMKRHGDLLWTLEVCFIVFFSIEYLLRLWSAVEGCDGVKGWRGSVKYATSVFGIIDLIAILPFFATMVFPAVHLGWLRIFRLLRILLLARHIKSFSLLKRAMLDKRAEMAISLQVVVVLTVVLSVIMYEIENAAQPDKFTDIAAALGWSVAKFIGGIGGFGDFYPVTPAGRIVATMIGLLGIALFAIPAGIVASGFMHEMDVEKGKKEIDEKRTQLLKAFRDVENDELQCRAPRKYLTIVQAKSRFNLTEEDVIKVVRDQSHLRLRYKRVNRLDTYPNSLIIEHFVHNAIYGSCITKGSSPLVTVICPTSYDETSIGHFSRCLAIKLGAGYISNEFFGTSSAVVPEAACSFSHNHGYVRRLDVDDERPKRTTEAFEAFKSDLARVVRPGTLAIVVRAMGKGGSSEETGANGRHGDELLLPQPLAMRYTASKQPMLRADRSGSSATDIHWFLKNHEGANTISLYVHPELLEWEEIDIYFETIARVADALKTQVPHDGPVVLSPSTPVQTPTTNGTEKPALTP